jgi:hypothetical protein
MRNTKILLAVLLSIASVFGFILSASAAMPLPDGASTSHSVVALNMSQGSVAPMVAVGRSHLVGLKSDGTVVAVGRNDEGQCEVSGWADIVQVAAGSSYTLGLQCNGTIVAAGHAPNLDRWTDIVQIAAGPNHVVGLRSDGTVVAKYNNDYWRGVGDWMGITQVAPGWRHTVGLRSDGTVVAVGYDYDGQCNVSDWTDIVQVTASSKHTVGLRSDGSVVAAGNDEHGQCDVGGWTDIVQVTTFWWTYTVGLKNDGTVVTTTPLPTAVDVSDWDDIIRLGGGKDGIAGLKSDGTVVSTEPDFPVSDWNLGITTEHTLTVSSMAGGVVTTPGEESFEYTAGAMIHLVAKPDAGYHFVNWTGDVDTVFNVNAATTVIAMNGDRSIAANFGKNPPILLLTLGIIAIVVLMIFLFRERRTTRS